jgi:hypothetical protein
MKISEIVQHCAAIERVISEVYRMFALRWPDGPLGAFWNQLADEEFSHGTILDRVACLPATDRDDPSIDSAKLVGIRDFVEGRFPFDQISLDQAFDLALDLEDLELDNIYRRLLAMTSSDHRMAEACKSALGQVSHHEQRIADMIETFSTDGQLRDKAAERHRQALKTGAPHCGSH